MRRSSLQSGDRTSARPRPRHHNLGNALRQKGRLDEAIAAYRRAIALRPEFVEVHNNLGNALSDKGRLDEAIDAYRRAIALRPDYAAAHSNLGVAFKGKGWLDEAIAALGRAAELNPDLPEVHLNLGSTLLARGDREEANRAYRRALALRPGNVAAHSNLLTCEQYQSGVTLAALARAHAEWDERHAAPYRAGWKPWDLDRDAERPLRLGFVSPDLCRHPVGHFLVRALENLDRRVFAVVCYYTGTKPRRVVRPHRRRGERVARRRRARRRFARRAHPRRPDRYPLRPLGPHDRQPAPGLRPAAGTHPDHLDRLRRDDRPGGDGLPDRRPLSCPTRQRAPLPRARPPAARRLRLL